MQCTCICVGLYHLRLLFERSIRVAMVCFSHCCVLFVSDYITIYSSYLLLMAFGSCPV